VGDDRVTVAVLGQGSIGRRHAALLLEAGAEVVAYDPASGREMPEGVRPARSLEEALSTAVAAVVASPTIEHLLQARLALEHGCHVLVEKPLSTSTEGLEDLLAMATALGRVLAVGFNLRFHPGPAQVRDIVLSGAIGRPLLAEVTCGSWLPGWRPDRDYRTTYSASSKLGGGVLLDASHELDYTTWMLGPATDVWAWMGTVSDLELDAEDTALLTLAHNGGTMTTVALDYVDRAYRRGCRIVGSEGSVDWRWDRQQAVVLRPSGDPETVSAPSDVAPSYGRQTAAFLDAVAAGAIPNGSALCDAASGVHSVAVADAARRSAVAEGRRTPVG
jgi:predicted dehydrogenase